MFLTSLKQTCHEYMIKFSENLSAPQLENRKTSPCSPRAPNLLHVLPIRDGRMAQFMQPCFPARLSHSTILHPSPGLQVRPFYSEKEKNLPGPGFLGIFMFKENMSLIVFCKSCFERLSKFAQKFKSFKQFSHLPWQM